MNLRSGFTRLAKALTSIRKTGDQVARGKAVDALESELEEMENIFGILVLGSFIGMPSPPMQVSLDLMPFMERELILMMQIFNQPDGVLSVVLSLIPLFSPMLMILRMTLTTVPAGLLTTTV